MGKLVLMKFATVVFWASKMPPLQCGNSK